jgi:hypothetical protein
MSWTKPYTLDFGPTGDNIQQGVDKLENDVDDIYTNLNKLKNAFVGTSSPSNPDTGQIWGDSNHTPILFKHYNGSIWVPLTKPSFRGQMINGKIAVTVGSNNLTVALKTSLGNDPSTSDPVAIRIGDTVRTVSSALSVTANAATNWGNAGGATLATKEIDWFVYLGYNSTDGVVIGFSRIPSANCYNDFSATSTNEKFCKISTVTNAAATDYYDVIGRFAATLSAGAGYTWTVPTFTAINIIQKPIYETRRLAWTAGWVGITGITDVSKYQIIRDRLIIDINVSGTGSGTSFTGTAPFNIEIPLNFHSVSQDNGTWSPGYINYNTNAFTIFQGISSTWTNSGARSVTCSVNGSI